eukprot:scaffold5644_cov148-Skeletonema_menzelii.AAC.3
MPIKEYYDDVVMFIKKFATCVHRLKSCHVSMMYLSTSSRSRPRTTSAHELIDVTTDFKRPAFDAVCPIVRPLQESPHLSHAVLFVGSRFGRLGRNGRKESEPVCSLLCLASPTQASGECSEPAGCAQIFIDVKISTQTLLLQTKFT